MADSSLRKLYDKGDRGFWPTWMLSQSTTKLVTETDCHDCNGTGIDPYFGTRRRCKPCDGTGKQYECYHDGSMFAGTDLRGVTREWNCPVHGRYGREGGIIRMCCDKRVLETVPRNTLLTEDKNAEG